MRVNAANPWDRGRWRVQLDGEDVGSRCFYADDATREVGLYKRHGSTGYFYIDEATGRTAQEFKTGHVSLTKLASPAAEQVGSVLGAAAQSDLPQY